MRSFITFLFLTLSMIPLFSQAQNNAAKHLPLWTGPVPGETESKHEPLTLPDQGDKITRITNVTDPALVVFDAGKTGNGAAVIISPGGGYGLLAIDLEGYEVAHWLNTLGISAFVLQYRVPGKPDAALQDLQRAMRLVRANAKTWNLNPHKIGIMGFSAGASLSARLCALPDTNLYVPVDKADTLSFRPGFCMYIYPAYLDKGSGRSITPEAAPRSDAVPAFLFATADDPHGNSALVMTSALRDQKVPVELHFLPYGEHGYGLRKGNVAAETWPGLARTWLLKVINGKLKPPVKPKK